MNKDIKKEFSKYLKSQRLMTLATCADKPWVATVYFAVDNDLNFYFVSSPKSKHCKDIEKNSKVAVNVADSHTPSSGSCESSKRLGENKSTFENVASGSAWNGGSCKC